MGPWGRATLEAAADFIVSSASAFADTELLEELGGIAAAHDAQVHVQPGALGTVDAIAAASLLGLEEVEHRIIKPPSAWQGTPAEERCNLNALEEPAAFFSGTATEAARSTRRTPTWPSRPPLPRSVPRTHRSRSSRTPR